MFFDSSPVVDKRKGKWGRRKKKKKREEKDETNLEGNDARSHNELRFGTDEAGPLGGARGRIEDTRNSIGFGEECAVDDGKAGPNRQSLDGTGDEHGLSQHRESIGIAQ